jgi:hypothetical protein
MNSNRLIFRFFLFFSFLFFALLSTLPFVFQLSSFYQTAASVNSDAFDFTLLVPVLLSALLCSALLEIAIANVQSIYIFQFFQNHYLLDF